MANEAVTAAERAAGENEASVEERVGEFVKALEEAKGSEVKVYDVRGKSNLTDFFVVATGAAAPHLKALVRALPGKAYRTAGEPDSGWVVSDYIDIVVHVFSAEARAYYALENLWTDPRP